MLWMLQPWRPAFELRGMITVKDIQKAEQYPNACKDSQERLRVGWRPPVQREGPLFDVGLRVEELLLERVADRPDIVHDLANPGQPRCSFGYILEALDRRRRRGVPPFTVMSCDNLQQNASVTANGGTVAYYSGLTRVNLPGDELPLNDVDDIRERLNHTLDFVLDADGEQAVGREVECGSCHNPHQATAAAPWLVSPPGSVSCA